MEDERRDVVRDHQYDGIQEFDNELPNWWLGTFVLTVLFGLYWFTTRHTFTTPDDNTYSRYSADMKDLRALQAAKAGAGPTDEQVLAAKADPAQLEDGHKVFTTNCIACHGPQGQGVIGPNLTDKYWIHGGKPSQIAHTITTGVPDKGMVTWGGVLKPEQIRHVAAYVLSIRGSNPPNPKAPQGNPED
jgi:cytochrome c oxidase cbb3-type subunit 3